MSLLNRKALVTGASRGLGRAIASRLAQEGCSVTSLARNRELLRSSVQELARIDCQQKHRYISLDLKDLIADTDRVTETIAKELEEVSILINCAGITSHSLLPRSSNDLITSMIKVNLAVPIILSKLAYKPMMRLSKKVPVSSEGHKFTPQILNVSSILSITGNTFPGTSVYAATKAGLIGFTESLAAELRGHIRVNSIVPGLLPDTDMGRSVSNKDGIPTASLEEALNKIIDLLKNGTINGKNISIP